MTAVLTRRRRRPQRWWAAWGIQYQPFWAGTAWMTFGNGFATTFSHDQDYRLLAATTVSPSAATDNLDYDRDLAGNVTAITDLLQLARNQTFEYDDLHRLVEATGPYGSTQAYGRTSNAQSPDPDGRRDRRHALARERHEPPVDRDHRRLDAHLRLRRGRQRRVA